jgi:hypothetical protein
MRMTRASFLPALLVTLYIGPARAEPYWSYAYGGIDVTAAGEAKYAHDVAHNVHRLELTARKLLDSDSDSTLAPTHIYSLDHSTFLRLRPQERYSPLFHTLTQVTSAFRMHDGENYVFMDAADERRYYGAYFGLAGSILASQKLRYPRWYLVGFARMLAPTQIRETDVTVGKVDEWMAKAVRAWKLKFIPVRVLLTADETAPALAGDLMTEKYAAECWLLVHLITIEGLHKSEFAQYLQLLSSGTPPAEAFSASFKISYEDLDKMLRNAMDKGTIRTLSFTVPDEPDTNAPRQLSAAEADARLAELSAVWSSG